MIGSSRNDLTEQQIKIIKEQAWWIALEPSPMAKADLSESGYPLPKSGWMEPPPSRSFEPRDALLQEQGKTYGSFEKNAELWHRFIAVAPFPLDKMKVTQLLAVQMIYLKLARMLANPQYVDNWNDIAGYAKLGGEACEPEK